MSPEDRARAVVAYFPEIPASIGPELQCVITRAIKRALNEQLGKLEIEADRAVTRAAGRGKSGKGYDGWAMKYHKEWRSRFHHLRTGHSIPDDSLLLVPR